MQVILGEKVVRPCVFDQDLVQSILSCQNDTSFQTVLGGTMCTDDFYEGRVVGGVVCVQCVCVCVCVCARLTMQLVFLIVCLMHF